MSINSMLFNGLSGVSSMSGNIGVVADNVANINTISYKSSSLRFDDLLSQTYEGVGQIGTGSQTGAIMKNYEVGKLELSKRSTDMAISGNGFFILDNPDQTGAPNESTLLYTRDGQFRAAESTGDPDAYLNLINPAGHFVQGINTGSVVNPTGVVENILIGSTSLPKATENVTLALNLEDDDLVEDVESNLFSSWDGTNLLDGVPNPIEESAYTYKSTIKIYDDSSENSSLDLTFYFDRTTQKNEREFLVTCDPSVDRRIIDNTGARYNDNGTVNKGAGALLYGRMNFSASGELMSIDCWDVPPDTNLVPTNANKIDLARGEGFYSFDYNISGTGPNLSTNFNFGTEPAPQTISSPETVMVRNGTQITPLQFENTNWDELADTYGNSVQDGDVISFAGSDGDGNAVAYDYTVDFNNTLSDLLTSLEGQFNCSASMDSGVLKLADNEIGDSQLAITSITYRDSSGNDIGTNPNLAQIFGDDSAQFNTILQDREYPAPINTTHYAYPSKTLYQLQDGYAKGYFQEAKVSQSGIVTGVYSNGIEVEQAQIVLADFINYGGLLPADGNGYWASDEAGEITVTNPGDQGLGNIDGYALEMSNVDLARQFVDLISTQRAFQANSTTLKTADEIYQTALQMMR